GASKTYRANLAAVQEVVVDTGGASAEVENGGANINYIPREGSNQLRGFGNVSYSDDHFASSKVQDYLRAPGINCQSSVKQIFDYGLGVGGAIKQDKLWFFGAGRWWGGQAFAANNYFNKSTNPLVYVPDTSSQAYTDNFLTDFSVRLTWQAAAKHKISFEEHL